MPTPAFPPLGPSSSSSSAASTSAGAGDGPGVSGTGLAITIAITRAPNASLAAAALAGTTLLSTESSFNTPLPASAAGGIALVLNANHSVTFRMSDGSASGTASLTSDSACTARIAEAMGGGNGSNNGGAPEPVFIGVSVDAGPRIVSIMIDGVLCDGGGTEPTGWAWFPPIGAVTGGKAMAVEGLLEGVVAVPSTRSTPWQVPFCWDSPTFIPSRMATGGSGAF